MDSRGDLTKQFNTLFASFLDEGLTKEAAAAKALQALKGIKLPQPSPTTVHNGPISTPAPAPPTPPPLNLDKLHELTSSTHLEELLQEAQNIGSYTKIIRLIGAVLSSAALLVEWTPAPDAATIINFHAILSAHAPLANATSYAMEALSHDLSAIASRISTLQQMTPLLLLLHYPPLADTSFSHILRNVTICITRLPVNMLSLLLNHISSIPPSHLRLLLTTLQNYITTKMSGGNITDVRHAVKCIALLYYHRDLFCHNISDFYNSTINSRYMVSDEGLKSEFKMWLKDQQAAQARKDCSTAYIISSESLISYPFILTAGTKASILELDSAIKMRNNLNTEYEMARATGSRYLMPYLVLRIRRDHVIEDTITYITHTPDSDLKKPLKIIFDNEDGVDEGGVRKEYYMIMFKQLLDLSFGMFVRQENYLWFNSSSMETQSEFELVGVLLGIAIYNSVIVDIPLPMVVYKKLKGLPVTLDDLSDIEPELARNLKHLLHHPITYELTFQITRPHFDDFINVDLIENGGAVLVTDENKQEYVNKYVSYVLNDSVSLQFEAFKRGFRKVCSGAAIDMFEPAELELLICGNPVLDFHALQSGTRYEGFTATSRVIVEFWEILHNFNEQDKRLFLKFLSGSDRSPIDGLSKLDFVISRHTDEDTRLPSAHTCFNHLLLPEYSSKEVLEQKLRYAITQAEGFGLR